MVFECTRAQEIDDSNRNRHHYLEVDDECYFIGEYTSHQGFGYSQINQAIYNLKIAPRVRAENPYRYP